LTENDSEFLSVVFGPFNPFVLVSVNSRSNDLTTPCTCDESFLFWVLSLLCGGNIRIAGSVCRLSVCTHVTTPEFLNEFPCFNLLNPNITACRASFKIQNPAFFAALYVYVLCGSQNTQKILLYITFSSWFL
jgi:hypothetical protein